MLIFRPYFRHEVHSFCSWFLIKIGTNPHEDWPEKDDYRQFAIEIALIVEIFVVEYRVVLLGIVGFRSGTS